MKRVKGNNFFDKETLEFESSDVGTATLLLSNLPEVFVYDAVCKDIIRRAMRQVPKTANDAETLRIVRRFFVELTEGVLC